MLLVRCEFVVIPSTITNEFESFAICFSSFKISAPLQFDSQCFIYIVLLSGGRAPTSYLILLWLILIDTFLQIKLRRKKNMSQSVKNTHTSIHYEAFCYRIPQVCAIDWTVTSMYQWNTSNESAIRHEWLDILFCYWHSFMCQFVTSFSTPFNFLVAIINS